MHNKEFPKDTQISNVLAKSTKERPSKQFAYRFVKNAGESPRPQLPPTLPMHKKKASVCSGDGRSRSRSPMLLPYGSSDITVREESKGIVSE